LSIGRRPGCPAARGVGKIGAEGEAAQRQLMPQHRDQHLRAAKTMQHVQA